MEVVLLDKVQHGATRQLVEGTLSDETLTTVVQSEEQVEHDADHGHEENHQCPGHRLGRLAIVHHHMDDSQCYQYPREGSTY